MSQSHIDIIEYNLNDNYRRYGFLSTSSLKSTTLNTFKSSAVVNTTTITSTEIVSTTATFGTLSADSIETGYLSASQINGFELVGSVNFNNQPTQNLVVTNLSADAGGIVNMTTIGSDQFVLDGISGSVTFEANFATVNHTLTFPPVQAIGVLKNNGFGDLVWQNDLLMNSIAIGDVSAGSSNIGVAESKLHVKGANNTTGGLLIESSADSINRLAIYSDTVANSTGIKKLASGSLTVYDSVGGKEFELDSAGDGTFYNDLDVQGDIGTQGTVTAQVDLNAVQNIAGGGRLTLRVRTTTNATTLDDDYILNVNNAGLANIDLPDITDSTYDGVTYVIIKQTSNTVRVRGDGPDLIHSSGVDLGQVDLTGPAGELLVVTSNGVKWFVIPS
jgi:hypothetical protein